jgi:hypothetical protein
MVSLWCPIDKDGYAPAALLAAETEAGSVVAAYVELPGRGEGTIELEGPGAPMSVSVCEKRTSVMSFVGCNPQSRLVVRVPGVAGGRLVVRVAAVS